MANSDTPPVRSGPEQAVEANAIPTVPSPSSSRPGHIVRFYEDNRHLIQSVVDFVSQGLATGEAACLLATSDHAEAIAERLREIGWDLDGLRNRGHYVGLNAQDLLSRCWVEDRMDSERFAAEIRSMLGPLESGSRPVRIFGEVVQLLCQAGRHEEACRLEGLWNDLLSGRRATLLCAYSLESFPANEVEAFQKICGAHSQVIPTERFSELPSRDDQMREIALLQHQSQQLRTEIALRQQVEREWTDFAEHSLEALHKADVDGRILWANQAELDLLGYSADEYIGRNAADFHVDPEACRQMHARLARGESTINESVQLVCRDGSIKDVAIYANAYMQDGEFLYSRSSIRDLTEWKAAERDRARLAAIIDSSEDAIISKTFDGIIRTWNAGAERLFGYSAQEAVGQPISLIIPADRRDEETEIIARLRQGERIQHFETVRVAKDGQLLDISLTISPIRDSAGNLIGASKIARDISSRKQADAALRASEGRYRQLLSLLPVGVYTCEASTGMISYYNEQAVILWGREPDLRSPTDRYCGSLRILDTRGGVIPHDQSPMAMALSEGREYRNQEAEIERPDGSIISVLVNIEPIRDADGRIIAAINVFQDVTFIKQVERQLRDEDRRKDEFIATLAHELRNPLAPIRNGLQALRMFGDDEALAESMHEILERQMSHLVRLIDDLLDISRIRSGKIVLRTERLDLRAALAQAIESTQPMMEQARHQLQMRLPEEPLWLDGDLVRLTQVFANLLNNAAKYTPESGQIIIKAKREGQDAVVSVQDSGIGIPTDMLDRVFDMFAQVRTAQGIQYPGLGIGLNLVKTLISLHGGDVQARSPGLGQGSEFVVRLPLLKSQPQTVSPDAPSGRHERNAALGTRILVVDDNKDSADSVAMLLRLIGMRVDTCYDGATALALADKHTPTAIVMDLGMPDPDGYEVARRLRRNPRHQKTLLIAMTGWGQDEDRRRSQDAGFDHHLVKPIAFPVLRSLLGVPTSASPTAGHA